MQTNQSRQTIPAPANYAALIVRTAPLARTLPIDPASYAALIALRDQVVAELYSNLELAS